MDRILLWCMYVEKEIAVQTRVGLVDVRVIVVSFVNV